MRVILLLIATLVDVASAARSLPAQRPSGPPPGILVDVNGHKLHLRCAGPTDVRPTVVLEAGGGGYSATWSRVMDLLRDSVRTCAYDRAGLGWSEPGPAPRTMNQEAFELHELLRTAHIPGPYVLVGHSIGGLLVRLFQDRYDKDVAGMVLVDPTHESATLYNTRVNRWVRLRELASGRTIPAPITKGDPRPYTPEDDYLADEFEAIYQLRQRKPVPLGDRPLIVLGAGNRSRPPGPSDSLWLVLKSERDEQVLDLSRLSRNSRFVQDPRSGHEIQQDNPQLVATVIANVVRAVKTGEAFHK